MKKSFKVSLLALAVTLSLASCDQTKKAGSSADSTATAVTDTANKMIDSAKRMTDTAKKMVDSAKNKMGKMVDSAKKGKM